jgi:hypothetical protein
VWLADGRDQCALFAGIKKTIARQKMKYNLGTIIVMLAAIGLLMAPALGAQGEKGGCKAHNGAMWTMNNLTEKELNNMTLGELRALKQKEMQDLNCTGPGNARNEAFNESKLIQNKGGCMVPGNENAMIGCNGQRRQDFSRDGADRGCRGLEFLLMDNITAETINNMTIGQIHQLQQEKIQELNNMTLAQIKDLRQKKMQARENMTLGELKYENENMREIAWIFGGMKHGIAGSPNAEGRHKAMGKGPCMMNGDGPQPLNQ